MCNVCIVFREPSLCKPVSTYRGSLDAGAGLTCTPFIKEKERVLKLNVQRFFTSKVTEQQDYFAKGGLDHAIPRLEDGPGQ